MLTYAKIVIIAAAVFGIYFVIGLTLKEDEISKHIRRDEDHK
ncbi:hypothetical protein [Ferrovum sp.]|nr:hypothetical protein [Ferrovum sp.]